MEQEFKRLPASILRRVTKRGDLRQVFVFHGEGEPFWALSVPPSPEDLAILEEALDHIEKLEQVRPKPFLGHDLANRFTVAALEEELNFYLVCIGLGEITAAATQKTLDVAEALRGSGHVLRVAPRS